MIPLTKFKTRLQKRRFYKAMRFIACKEAYVFARERFPSQTSLDYALRKSVRHMEELLKKKEGIT